MTNIENFILAISRAAFLITTEQFLLHFKKERASREPFQTKSNRIYYKLILRRTLQ